MVPSDRCQLFCCRNVSPLLSYDNCSSLLLALFREEKVHFVIPPNIPGPVLSLTQTLLAPASLPPPPVTPSPVKWVTQPSHSWSIDTPILTINLPQSSGLPQQISWHRRGDYLATVCKYYPTLSFSIACLIFVCSKWWHPEWNLDPSGHTKALTGPFQES
jgi:hypothetical protein